MINNLILIHNINPIAFSYNNFQLSWYWFFYIVDIVIVYGFLKLLEKNKIITFSSTSERLDLLLYPWIGLIIGARLFYVLIYDPKVFIENPQLIFQFWHGGMSFHGGIVGVLFGLYLFTRSYRKKNNNNRSFFFYSDTIVTAIPCALALGRLGNFLNQELVGRISYGRWPWLVHFPLHDFPSHDYDPEKIIYRHPTQLYEMFFECLLLFIVLWVYKKNILNRPKMQTIIFLYWIAIMRFIIEFFREPDKEIGFILNYFTLGQVLSFLLLLFAIGVHLMERRALKKAFR
ncbi:MAG: prolipoprotein diacylglyceryl transferase [Oligoflexia bacterium]|nr:prolipoprotein diacylglyceryl transferase [Oligoflexia bacterium]